MKKLWIAFGAILVFSFAVLGWIGTRIYQEMPPIPDRVVTTDRTGGHRARRDRPRAERLAVDGRDGDRLHLGSRQLCRARLDRRLAAPRTRFRARTSGRNTQFGKPYAQLSAETAGRAARAAAGVL